MSRTVRIENRMIASKVGWTAYDGREVRGWPVGTMIRGEIVMRDGALLGAPRGRPARFAETTPADSAPPAVLEEAAP